MRVSRRAIDGEMRSIEQVLAALKLRALHLETGHWRREPIARMIADLEAETAETALTSPRSQRGAARADKLITASSLSALKCSTGVAMFPTLPKVRIKNGDV